MSALDTLRELYTITLEAGIQQEIDRIVEPEEGYGGEVFAQLHSDVAEAIDSLVSHQLISPDYAYLLLVHSIIQWGAGDNL